MSCVPQRGSGEAFQRLLARELAGIIDVRQRLGRLKVAKPSEFAEAFRNGKLSTMVRDTHTGSKIKTIP